MTTQDRSLFRVAGVLLGVHLALWSLSALGIPWSRSIAGTLWLVVALAGCLALRAALPTGLRFDLRHRPSRLTLAALGLGFGAFGGLALASWLGWNIHPDWVFHWGPKAQRFVLAQGIDVEFLGRPWNGHVHPDYPTLLPNLTASLALALGVEATPRVGAVVTLLFAALWFAALRRLALRIAGPGWVAETAWVTAAWCGTMFGTGFQQAGGGDLPFGCVVTLGALALAAPLDPAPLDRKRPITADLHVALAAALASQIKFEGWVFASLLVAAWLVRRGIVAGERRSRRALWTAAATSALLPAVVVTAWALWNRHHGFFLPSNAGALDLGRLDVVARGLWAAASERAWHGLPFLLLAWPWLWLRRDTRWPALLLAGQMTAYVGVYLTTPVDLDLLLLTSASRLLYHLVPTFLVLLVVAIGLPARRLGLSTDGQSAESAEVASSSDEPVNPSFLA